MKYCSKCGREIVDKKEGCIYCDILSKSRYENPTMNRMDAEREARIVGAPSVSSQYHNRQPSYAKIEPALKVLILALIFFFWGIGPLFGIVFGIYCMKKENPFYCSFGKIVLTVSITLIVLNFLCIILVLNAPRGYF